MKRQIAVWVLILTVIFSLAGPAAARSAKRDLAVSYYEKRIMDLGSSGLTLAFVFKVANSSSSAWHMTGYDYRVVIENAEYFRLAKQLDQPITIAPAASTLIALPVKITNDNLFNSNSGASGKDKLSCYLIGGLVFSEEPKPGGDRLSAACSGDFPIYKDIKIIFQPLEVRALTIGGGDMTFKVVLRNDNFFPLQVDSLRYTLDLGTTRVSEGPLLGARSLEAKSEKEFSVPLLLDFFEVGNALYSLLQKPPVPCRFDGELLMSTDWGQFRMPLVKKEDIPVRNAR
jgi:LEA14-like dessication related protein